MNRRRRSETEGVERAAKKCTFSSIKSNEELKRVFDLTEGLPDHREFTPTVWNVTSKPQLVGKIVKFLEQFSAEWFASFQVMKKPIDNESSVYPFIFDLLKSLTLIVNNSVIVESLVVHDVLEEGLDEVATEVCGQVINSASSSRHHSTEDPETGASASDAFTGSGKSVAKPPVFDRVEGVLLTPGLVKDIYIAVQSQMRSELFNTGRVEFAVLDAKTSHFKSVIEAKLSVTTDKNEGLYQAAAYAIAASVQAPTVVYGAYTDYRSWIFFEWNKDTRIFKLSEDLNLFSSDYKVYSPFAIDIVAFLFEIFGVPEDIDIEATVRSASAKYAPGIQKLFSHLRFHPV